MTARLTAAPLLAALIAAVYLIWAPPSADLAAALYRAGEFSRDGFVLVDPQWYAGFAPLGYSLLLGPLGSLLGVRLLGALSAVAAAAVFARLTGHPKASLWFAVGVAVSLGSGRVAFTLGVALGLGALLARRGAAAAALAVACACASPLAGAFLALAALTRRRPRLAVAALIPVAALALLFPTAGYEPFAPSSFWPALALLAVLAALAPRLRVPATLYALVISAAFVLPSAVGGNAVRLGAFFAGPLAALTLKRGPALALLALPLAYWQLQAPIRDVAVAAGDPSTTAAYYAPLEHYLGTLPGGPRRIEVPFTRSHWEAALLAPRVALARGWERQLDIADNTLFYRSGLTSAAYADWLAATGVSVVALPDVQLDYSARAEAALIRAGTPALRALASLAHWRVYAVVGARPLADPPATLTQLGPDQLVLSFARPGTSLVRVRWCAGGFIHVSARRAGRVKVAARLDRGTLLERGRVCRGSG